MEPLIVALIIMAVSAFFGNKKKNEEKAAPQNQTRSEPFSRTRNQGGFKRMEDYAKEIYGEFQAQMNPEEPDKKEQVKEAAKNVVEKRVSDRQSSERQSSDRKSNRQPTRKTTSLEEEEIGGRLSAHRKQSRPVQEVAKKESGDLFPLTQSEAQKAIILAEVFMPPKSKR